MNIWHELEIEATDDQRAIKRAYAAKLKRTHPEDNPEGFQRLREAYEYAVNLARDDSASFHDTDDTIESQPGQTVQHELSPDIPEPEPEPEESETEQQDQTHSNEPYPAAYHVFQLIQATLTEGDQLGAADHLISGLAQDELTNLDARLRLEVNLVDLICTVDEFPFHFAFMTAELFHWEDDSRHLLQYIPDEADYVLSRIKARKKYQELTKQGKKTQASVMDSLLGKFSPWLFRLRALRKLHKTRVNNFLFELDQAYPELVHYELDDKNIEWWEAAINRRHFGWSHIFVSILTALQFIKPLHNAWPGMPGNSIAFVLLFIIVIALLYGMVSIADSRLIPLGKSLYQNFLTLRTTIKTKAAARAGFLAVSLLITATGVLLPDMFLATSISLLTLTIFLVLGFYSLLTIGFISIIFAHEIHGPMINFIGYSNEDQLLVPSLFLSLLGWYTLTARPLATMPFIKSTLSHFASLSEKTKTFINNAFASLYSGLKKPVIYIVILIAFGNAVDSLDKKYTAPQQETPEVISNQETKPKITFSAEQIEKLAEISEIIKSHQSNKTPIADSRPTEQNNSQNSTSPSDEEALKKREHNELMKRTLPRADYLYLLRLQAKEEAEKSQ